MRPVCWCILIVVLAAPALAADAPALNTLTAEEQSAGWQLLFDGHDVPNWHIVGESQVKDGVLILGGASATSVEVLGLGDEFDLRFEQLQEGSYNLRTEHRGSFGLSSGMTSRDYGAHTPPEWVARQYRRYYDSATGSTTIETEAGTGGSGNGRLTLFRIDIPAGSKLHLRNVKLKPGAVSYAFLVPFVLTALLVGTSLVGLFVWKRYRRRRRQVSAPTLPGLHQ